MTTTVKATPATPCVSISQAIKAALKVAGSPNSNNVPHGKMLDAVAQHLGYASFRALKAAEPKQSTEVTAKEHPLLAAYKEFQLAHPGLNLELAVPFQPGEGTDLPPFKFPLDLTRLTMLVEMEKSSITLKTVMRALVGKMPIGYEGTGVSLGVVSLSGQTWVGFSATTWNKYREEITSSQGDLSLSELVSSIENAKACDFSEVQVGQHAVIDESCMAYRVDQHTIRLACELTSSSEYTEYPSVEDCITLSGFVENAAPEHCLEGFLGSVIESAILEWEYDTEEDAGGN